MPKDCCKASPNWSKGKAHRSHSNTSKIYAKNSLLQLAMNIIFAPTAWDDYLYWQSTDKKMVKRINELIKAILREPFTGIGKPEPLKHMLAGYWSRRIDGDHRLVYKISEGGVLIAQCRYHY